MKVLNGQEGDAADLDDIQGIFEGNEDDDDDNNALDDTQRSVKLMLRSKLFNFYLVIYNFIFSGGVIPDSTMIHAARKRRQMAREMGVPGDYMSLNSTAENGTEGTSSRKSRLVRYENIFIYFFNENQQNLFI